MIAMDNPACDDLFDSVAQSLFGIGLQLEGCLEATEDAAVSARIDASVRGLHDIIQLIRARGELHCKTTYSL